MYKLGTLVQEERAHLKDLYGENSEATSELKTSKLQRFQQELQRRREKQLKLQQEALQAKK